MQSDADKVFNIVDERARHEAIDILTGRQLSHCIMILAITQTDVIGSGFYDSLNGLINQEIRPHFRRYWRGRGIPVNIDLFPQLASEIEQNELRAKSFRQGWLQKKHGGARNFAGFLKRTDVGEIIEFIVRVQPLWKYAVRYFHERDYDAGCVEAIQSDVQFQQLSGSENVSAKVLKDIYRRKQAKQGLPTPKSLQPLGFAISHARERFDIKQSNATILRWYRRAVKPKELPTA
jgi:hypothetical protein